MPSKSAWMLLAALLFAAMAALIKIAVQYYSVFEIIFYRSLFGAALCFMLMKRARVSIGTKHPWRHLVRCAIGTTCISLGVYILGAMPIAHAQALNYTSPLWFCLFLSIAMAAAKEKLDLPLLGIVFIGFAGILLILRPDASSISPLAAAAGVLAGLTGGAADFMIRNLSQHKEPSERIVFYFTCAGTLFGLAASAAFGFSPHTAAGAALLIGIGLAATIAQLSLTAAWAGGHPVLNSILQFSGIPFAVLIGSMFFDEKIDALTLAGIAVVAAAGISSCVILQRKRRPR